MELEKNDGIVVKAAIDFCAKCIACVRGFGSYERFVEHNYAPAAAAQWLLSLCRLSRGSLSETVKSAIDSVSWEDLDSLDCKIMDPLCVVDTAVVWDTMVAGVPELYEGLSVLLGEDSSIEAVKPIEVSTMDLGGTGSYPRFISKSTGNGLALGHRRALCAFPHYFAECGDVDGREVIAKTPVDLGGVLGSIRKFADSGLYDGEFGEHIPDCLAFGQVIELFGDDRSQWYQLVHSKETSAYLSLVFECKGLDYENVKKAMCAKECAVNYGVPEFAGYRFGIEIDGLVVGMLHLGLNCARIDYINSAGKKFLNIPMADFSVLKNRLVTYPNLFDWYYPIWQSLAPLLLHEAGFLIHGERFERMDSYLQELNPKDYKGIEAPRIKRVNNLRMLQSEIHSGMERLRHYSSCFK